MDSQRAILAIIISFLILLGYQYLFIGSPVEQERPVQEVGREEGGGPGPILEAAPDVPGQVVSRAVADLEQQIVPVGRDINIETEVYRAVISESGGGFKSFKLKEYPETMKSDSGLVELVQTNDARELPLYFSWGVEPDRAEVPLFVADRQDIRIGAGRSDSLALRAELSSGLEITRTLTFDGENYLIQLDFEIRNNSTTALQGSPYLTMTNQPFGGKSDFSRYLFSGPALLFDGDLQEIKVDDLAEEPQTFRGKVGWTAYEGTYFLAGVIPGSKDNQTVHLAADGDKISTVLSGEVDIIPAQGSRKYSYALYFGPKKLAVLKEAGSDLDKIVNFGWFDKMAKPALYLLNFFYRFVHNYGVAIILTTVLIKLVLWPITSKGMRSMKNMQALQPKMAKLREKYKDDANRMNQETMNLYKTYKINPLGGCLPMFLQIPVFFALYKVLLQAIELRHAPFMLWITDLSAPDRLWIGLGIPYLGGIPVLTLLMGGSMFLQQKLTPTPADPTQAKIMMFLPIIFTFMFLNFASGLVLYWFVNNLLSIGQQYMVNKPVKT